MARVNIQTIEVLVAADTPNARVAVEAVEVLFPRPTPSPTTITGAGVSQSLVELLISQTAPNVRVAAEVIEILMTPVVGGTIPSEFTRKAWVTID